MQFDPQTLNLIHNLDALQDSATAKSLQAQRTVEKCLHSNPDAILKLLKDNPDADAAVLAQNLAAHLHTFLMIAPADAHSKAPAAFVDALEAKGANLTDLDIAAMAYCANNGKTFIITRRPADARAYRKELEAQGKVAKQWNRGAYIVVSVQA